ncbi:MAG TPA: UbiA family prenyltransferase, partial [Geobacteraceae bacterium]
MAIEARIERKYPQLALPDGIIAHFFLLIKPGIQAAVLLAGFTGMVLAQRGWPEVSSCLACLASLFLAASGSAMINGLLEAEPDRHMVRLKTRVTALEIAGPGRVLTVALASIAASSLLAIRYLN